jgi:hypothetical protein
MRFEALSFGSIRIDAVTYEHDVVVDNGAMRKRKKRASKRFRDAFDHTPLSLDEGIPWKCRRLIVGTGASGAMRVMETVKREAKRRGVELIIIPTARAIDELNENLKSSTQSARHAWPCEWPRERGSGQAT